jgi:hypothetical protein
VVLGEASPRRKRKESRFGLDEEKAFSPDAGLPVPVVSENAL